MPLTCRSWWRIDSFLMRWRSATIHKRGYIVGFLLNVGLVHDSDNRPLYFVSQIQDITERR